MSSAEESPSGDIGLPMETVISPGFLMKAFRGQQ